MWQPSGTGVAEGSTRWHEKREDLSPKLVCCGKAGGFPSLP